jgi:hypothetical protein
MIKNNLLPNLRQLQRAQWQKAMEAQGHRILQQARINAPIRTGRLIRSGVMDKKRVKAGYNGIRIAFRVPYAIYMHEKHYRAKIKGGRRYLHRAIKSEAHLLRTQLAGALRQAIRGGAVRTTT